MNAKALLVIAAMTALFAFATACGEGTATPEPSATAAATSTPGNQQATATPTRTAIGPTATAVAATPTTVAGATATPTAVPLDIDLSGLDAIDTSIDFEGVFGEMEGLDIGQFDVQTEYMTDLEAPTEVEMPDLEFTLELP